MNFFPNVILDLDQLKLFYQNNYYGGWICDTNCYIFNFQPKMNFHNFLTYWKTQLPLINPLVQKDDPNH